MLQEFLSKPYTIYIIIYGLFLMIGLFVGLSFGGLMVLILGGVISVIAAGILNQPMMANVVSFICGAIAFYIFINREV
jgi:hypothetical protein